MGKARIDVKGKRATITITLKRNEQGRLPLGEIKVKIEPLVDHAGLPRVERCLKIFEDYCLVTYSVRQGIQVQVSPR